MWLKFAIFLQFCVFWSCQKCPKVETDFGQVNCTKRSEENNKNESFYYHFDESSCMPVCSKYSEGIYNGCSNHTQCSPGYFCEKRCGPKDELKKYTCEIDSDCSGNQRNAAIKCSFYCVAQNTGSCMSYHCNTKDYMTTYWTAQKFKPVCDNEGNWQAKQCKGGVAGRCMCFDAQGNRIFGEALFQHSKDMTCACSRKKSDLLAAGRSYVSFHCDSMGNYEKLQCDQISKQCWCVESKTGDLTSPVVPEKAMKKLPCYISVQVGSQYLRQCESKKYAQSVIEKQLMARGIQYVSSDFLLCDDDGSYGSYKIIGDNVYCTWKNNSQIGTWQENASSGVSNLNCNCARDVLKYDHKQKCEQNGNYKELQVISNGYYCVDLDGFSKSDIYTDSNLNCTNFY